MIACDGGCEDWFHGSCVNVAQEDEDLIDRYICTPTYANCKYMILMTGLGPECETDGKTTTWKRRCRLDGCRQPALVHSAKPSKYCSAEHGREFMRRQAQVTELPKSTKRKRAGDAAEIETGQDIATGGILAKEHLATLARYAKNVNDFRKIGSGALTPPPSARSENGKDDMALDDLNREDVVMTESERQRLNEIDVQQARVETTVECLKDRERFVQLVRDRAKRVQEDLGLPKDICGFDSRLTWSDEEFSAWRSSDTGQKAFQDGILPPPPPSADDDVDMENGGQINEGLCQKKRCERHRQWRVNQVQDIRFEQANTAASMRLLVEKRDGIRERAKLRVVMEADGDRQGTVEIVR